MNIHHTSTKFGQFSPTICCESKIRHLSNVLEAYEQEKPDSEDSANKMIDKCVKMVAYAKLISSEDPFPLSVAHLILALTYIVKKGYWKQGEQHSSDAILHAEAMRTSRDQINTLVESYYVLGFCRWKLNKNEDAFEAVTAAKNCLQELSLLKITPEDPDLEYKINVLAASCSPLKQQFLEQALANEGPPDKNAYIYIMLAQFYKSNGDVNDAVKMSKQALDLAEQFEDLAMRADCTRCLGECYLESQGHGCWDEGIMSLRNSIALYTSHFDGLHTATLSTYDILTNALINQEQYEEAIEELKSIKEAKSLKFGEYSKQMADFYKQLGSLHLILVQTKEALSVFKTCLLVLSVIQTKPNNVTTSIRNTIKSLEASKTTEKPAFNLYSKIK